MSTGTWTDPVDRASGYVVTHTNWNQMVGDTGNLQYLYESGGLWGTDTTERTTTSTAATDLVTISSLSITADLPVRITGVYRKDASAAQTVGLGLKVNSTTVIEAGTSNCILSSATAQAENGWFEIIIPPRSTNYLAGVHAKYFTRVASTGANTGVNPMSYALALTALLPNATITSLVIRGINNTSNNNLAVKDVRVYVG